MSFQINISNNLPLIFLFNRYIETYPQYFSLKINQKLVETRCGTLCTIFEEPLSFDDIQLNAKGVIHTKYEIINELHGKTTENYEFIIVLDKQYKGSNYLNAIRCHLDNEERHGNRVNLNYYKILNKQLITYNFYDKKLSDWSLDVEKLRKEFFSQHKKYLFDVMGNREKNGNWSNLILYGEPGTGKSSFVFRLAMQLKMNIISIDLSLYIDKKRELYSIFHGNNFRLPFDDKQISLNKNCIIILEEFDSTIKKIQQLENIFQFKNQTIKFYVEGKTNDLTNKVQALAETDILEDSRFSSNNDIEPNKINSEISEIVKTMTEDNKSDVVRLQDLLELFQGPIPVKDRVIVATTNNFTEIQSILPALFRSGRLTPIYFTYLDWDSFVSLCEYYFGKKPVCQPFEITIPTSQITELANKYVSLMKGSLSLGVNEFINEIKTFKPLNIDKPKETIKAPIKTPKLSPEQLNAIKILKKEHQENLNKQFAESCDKAFGVVPDITKNISSNSFAKEAESVFNQPIKYIASVDSPIPESTTKPVSSKKNTPQTLAEIANQHSEDRIKKMSKLREKMRIPDGGDKQEQILVKKFTESFAGDKAGNNLDEYFKMTLSMKDN